MKKIIFLSLISLCFIYQSCKKEDDVSKVVKVEYPTIEFLGASATGNEIDLIHMEIPNSAGFVSIPVGSDVDLNPKATTGSETSVVEMVSDGELDVNTPGLYLYEFRSKNASGFITYARFYVAVTDERTSYLEGNYLSSAFGGTVSIINQAPGLYLNTDATGDASGVNAVFVQISPTTILLPEQPTDLNPNTDIGPFGWSSATLSLSPDTTITYIIEETDTITLTRTGGL